MYYFTNAINDCTIADGVLSLQSLLYRNRWGAVMANLVVRNLDQRIVDALKQRAARHGRSAEAEHRAVGGHRGAGRHVAVVEHVDDDQGHPRADEAGAEPERRRQRPDVQRLHRAQLLRVRKHRFEFVERLDEAGYRTVGVSGNFVHVNAKVGFDRGFVVYDYHPSQNVRLRRAGRAVDAALSEGD